MMDLLCVSVSVRHLLQLSSLSVQRYHARVPNHAVHTSLLLRTFRTNALYVNIANVQ